MSQLSNDEMVSRIAARFIRAQDDQQQQQSQQQQDQQQQAQQEQQALPQSAPGMSAVKTRLDEVNAAFEEGDKEGFHKALDGLIKAAKHGGM